MPRPARRARLDENGPAKSLNGNASQGARVMNAAKRPNRRQVLAGGAALALGPGLVRAQAARPLKIGILNDMSSVYADFQGIGSVIAAQLAVDDFSKTLGVPVEIVSADHQNKPDVGSAIARRWIDTENVDVVMDLPNSAVALAVVAVAEEKNKAVIGSGAGSSVMTGPKCSRNFVHWTYDTYSSGAGAWQSRHRRGRKDLVLRHCRLHFRQGHGGELHGRGRGRGRQGARVRAPSASTRRTSRRFCCRRRGRARTSSLRQWRRRHQRLLQAGA